MSTQERPSRWEILARERNSRVILCHTPDTYVLTDLAKAADRAVRALRNRIYISLNLEDVGPLFEDYNAAIISLHQAIEKISEKVDIKYRAPRTILKMMGLDGNNGGNGDGSTEDESQTKLS